MTSQTDSNETAQRFAIVGMSVQVPGADTLGAFWQNLAGGVESIRRRSTQELLDAGENPDLIARAAYVPAAAMLDGYRDFDADFFGFSPKEAAVLDPQHRKFLEVAWHSLENAGHSPDTFAGRIGVYAGCGMGSYFYFNICSNPHLVEEDGMFLLRHTGNDKDFLSTRVSHVFDLRGPSINLQTACSTSLVAVHYACRALAAGDCDMALAGGVTIELPQGRGYLYKENEILSPDGHCRAFDHRSQGTVFGSGAGSVVIRRLEDARADGDHIHAVILGSAINNDGADKAGYLAPSVGGQAAAVRGALDAAGVSAASIGYVECHGTGTYLGDPIEVSALAEAFRPDTEAPGTVRIGSLKTNIGHLDTAAGVAALAKTVLALGHAQIPPSLGFEAPNPAMDIENTPFVVNDTLTDWQADGPRRAGVTALGVGGTNAHVVVEQAPPRPEEEPSIWPFHLLCISGRSKGALDGNTAALAAHLRAHPDLPLEDVAFTLKTGRRAFERRRVVAAETATEAAQLLETGNPRRVFTHQTLGDAPQTVFLFPGGGAQYPDMARDLYETEPVFAEWIDQGLAHLEPQIDHDIRALWLPEPDQREAAAQTLKQPSVQLPLLMIVEYALAQLWISWGLKPAALAGHSMGENTAACLAGVIGFEDCIDLVLLRGRLFDRVERGGMLSVSLPLEELEPLLGDTLDIASVNGPQLCAVSGSEPALDDFAAMLDARDIEYQRVAIDVAAHSRMLDPILPEFRAFLRTLTLRVPMIPIYSNRDGAVLSDADATDPEYWVQQLRGTVRFADCIGAMAKDARRVFLEVGPGKALSTLARMNADVDVGQAFSTLRHPDQDIPDDAYFLGVIGQLWTCGVDVDWDQIWGEARRRRVPLPGYAFQRRDYFIEPGTARSEAEATQLLRHEQIEDWGYRAVWRPRAVPGFALDDALRETPPLTWLLFADASGLAERAAATLIAQGHRVTLVHPGDSFLPRGDGSYTLAPEQGREGYDLLLTDLAARGLLPNRIGHFWLVTRSETFRAGSNFYNRNVEHGFYALMYLAQAMSAQDMPDAVHISIFTNEAAQVREEALPHPEKSMVAASAGVIPHEMPGISCTLVDLELPPQPAGAGRFFRRGGTDPALDTLDARVLEDLLADPHNAIAAYRGGRRLERMFRPAPLLPPTDTQALPWKSGGTYLITGGFGGIALAVAEDLAQRLGANIALLGRSALPDPEEWDAITAAAPPGEPLAQRIAAIRRIEAAGGTVLCLAADICNVDQMHRAATRTREEFGGIDGVIHAAGVIHDGPLLTKTAAEAEAVFAPKITGARVLAEVFADGALDLLVLFSSTSTVTRPAGQIDYAAANEYLNAFAQSLRGGRTRVVAVNWGVWADVGMAAAAMSDPDETAATPTPVREPLLDTVQWTRDGARSYRLSLPETHWILDEHRMLDGTALLPGTGYVALTAQAARAQGLTGALELSDLMFLRPLLAAPGAARQIEVNLTPGPDGFEVETCSDCVVDGRAATMLNARGVLAQIAESERPAPLDLAAISARCPDRSEAQRGARLKAAQEVHLQFGQRWQTLTRTALGDGEGLAELTMGHAAQGDLDTGIIVHPAQLDIATGWAMGLVPGYNGKNLWVPVRYRSIRIFGPLPARVLSWARYGDAALQSPGMARFDVSICAPDGTVLIEVTGFEIQRTAGAPDLSAAQPDARDVTFTQAARSRSITPEEERLARAVRLGIRPAEGTEALHRAVAGDAAQIVISSLPLDTLIAQADMSAKGDDDAGHSFERPELDSDYAPPTTPTEQVLADMWQSLLGVSRVGVDDSFFDLGGHSLIAVRLFAQIRRRFGAEFPMSVLLDHQTIAQLSGLIVARTGGAGDDSADEGAAGQNPKQVEKAPFSHLVPLAVGGQGDGQGDGKPFFLVAGMFGNVLNLRHLALLLGRDRPVYGLQARGLLDDEPPHETLQDAARDYIEGIRKVQPNGPYLIGGFSGGGLIAYEMAQQLEAAGEQVAQLVMLDTPLPVRPGMSIADRVLLKVQDIRRRGGWVVYDWVRERIAWELSKRRGDDDAARMGFNSDKIAAAFYGAIAVYKLKRWGGPMLLLRPPLEKHWRLTGGNWANARRELVFEDNQWTPWIDEMRVEEVPGDHDSMVLMPNVTVTAAHVAAALAAADDTARSGGPAMAAAE